MHNNRWIFITLAVFVLAAGVGVMAYNAGVAHGIAQSGKMIAPSGPGPYPYPYYYGWHPWGFGFFFVPFFFFFLFAFLVRGIFWRGHHRHGYGCGYRHDEGGVPQQP